VQVARRGKEFRDSWYKCSLGKRDLELVAQMAL
jgi:hypothetical protein